MIIISDIKKLESILLVNNIELYENELFNIIPELRYEKDFDQKSDWHAYDVWHHTLKAIESCDNNFFDRLILLLHDIGKPFSYQDDNGVRHFKNHAHKSAIMAETILNRLKLDKNIIEEIVLIINNHAKKIDITEINSKNYEYYKRLIKIQKCDANAYEKSHANDMIKQLSLLENDINCKYNHIN